MTAPESTVSVPLVNADSAPVPVPVVQVAASSVHVTPAQVWSAAIQNIIIVIALTVMYALGKLDQTIWLSGLGYVSGIDLFGRMRLTKSVGGAMAIGATGALGALARLMPHVAFLLAFLPALSGCATVSSLPTKTGEALLKVEDGYRRMDQLYAAVCEPEPVVPKAATFCSEADKGLHEEALPAINEAVDLYMKANALLKDGK